MHTLNIPVFFSQYIWAFDILCTYSMILLWRTFLCILVECFSMPQLLNNWGLIHICNLSGWIVLIGFLTGESIFKGGWIYLGQKSIHFVGPKMFQVWVGSQTLLKQRFSTSVTQTFSKTCEPDKSVALTSLP